MEGGQGAALAWSDLNVVPQLRSMRMPVTTVLGTRDRWVDVHTSREVWVTNLASRQVEVVDLPAGGHYPTLTHDPSDWNEIGPWHPRYEQALDQWAAKLCAPTSRSPD